MLEIPIAYVSANAYATVALVLFISVLIELFLFKFIFIVEKRTEDVLDDYWLWIEPIMVEASSNAYTSHVVKVIAVFASRQTTWTWTPGAEENCKHFQNHRYMVNQSIIDRFVSHADNIDEPIEAVPGVGQRSALIFHKHGIPAVRELVEKFNEISGGSVHPHSQQFDCKG
jgi:hypothetical protein